MGNLRVVTTSWDDGDPKDRRLAEVLHVHGVRGTFYVPIIGYLQRKTLRAIDLRELSYAGFEIGAHTVSHKRLTDLEADELEYEVGTCKEILEQRLGHGVQMFCYPNGRYDDRVIQEVMNAKYLGARTTRMLNVNPKGEFRPFEVPTTVQAYPHATLSYLKNLGRARNVRGLMNYVTELHRFKSWVEIGKHLFNRVLERGGIWHLYGHSWEIEQLDLWGRVQEMLEYISHRKGVSYLTNGQLLVLLKDRDRMRAESRNQASLKLETEERGTVWY
jgi:hypothetical protein